jgi:hypothetical protein
MKNYDVDITIVAGLRHKYLEKVIGTGMPPRAAETPFQPDALDYKILSALTDNANMQPKDLAKMLGVDRRTLAKHLSRDEGVRAPQDQG